MSFVINTTVDKNQELLDAYKELYEANANGKDVLLISKRSKIAVDSFALVISSDFFRTLLQDNQRDQVIIMIPDIDPEILKKVVEYIYIGWISLDSKYMSDFIEACNLLQLKATISCERKLVFDKCQKFKFDAKATSTPTAPSAKQENLDSLIADLESEENVEYQLKHETSESGQILEVYEISNIDGAEISYEDADENEDLCEEQYELVNVIPDTKPKTETIYSETSEKKKRTKPSSSTIPDLKPRTPAKQVDEDILNKAIKEIISNASSFRIVSEKYQIPKTLLWRRAKKMGYIRGEKQKDSSRVEAIEEIKRGESLISLSKKFSIPISTLHREKLKLYEKGQLPENVNLKNRSRGDDYDARLRLAITEILNGKSQNEIAKKFNIPKTTIWRIIKKMDPDLKNNDAVVTPDSDIVNYLIQLSKKRSIKDENAEYDDKHSIVVDMMPSGSYDQPSKKSRASDRLANASSTSHSDKDTSDELI